MPAGVWCGRRWRRGRVHRGSRLGNRCVQRVVALVLLGCLLRGGCDGGITRREVRRPGGVVDEQGEAEGRPTG